MRYIDCDSESEAQERLKELKIGGYIGYVICYNSSWAQVRYWF